MTEPLVGPTPRGPRGFPGLYPVGAWIAGPYPKDTVCAHLNCIWRANNPTPTVQEPAFGVDGAVESDDWDLWIDARGAALVSATASTRALLQAMPVMRGEALRAMKAHSTAGVNWLDAFVAGLNPALTSDDNLWTMEMPVWPAGGHAWAIVKGILNAALSGGCSDAQIAALQAEALASRETI